MASSSSSSLPKYEVFLSFRGADTRHNFTSHLYAELCKKNIETFFDEDKLEKGDEISPVLSKAIDESAIYVIIFSQNYASSSWCLDELAKILECKKRYGRDVIPVFYKVDPSTVRYQKIGSYADAFVKHGKRFKDEVIRRWKDALTEAAGISGWDSNTTSPESMLVDAIVKDIIRKLNTSFSSTEQAGMVGIDEHIAQIQSLLQLESEAVRIIGIWGMGGIGKSTLARALYDKLATQFGSRSCVINAQQEIERVGIDCLHKKYLSELLEEAIPSNGLHFAVERVKRTKVLLILDDMNKLSQIKELIGGRGNFGQGSRIIVTSRDRQVLKNIVDDDGIYQVKEMNDQDSQKLFNLNAFRQICPKEGYEELVEKFLKYAKGIPLALNVLGALLLGKKKNEWKSQLEKLEKFPEVDIFNVLRLSYDGLDREQKDIFLDIVCFHFGSIVVEAPLVKKLNACGFSADIGLGVLKDRGLISSWGCSIMMHDLITEMGREIVRQECPHDPGKRSHLWKSEEINQVLRNNKGTDAIQCICLNKHFSVNKGTTIQLHHEKFKSMPNLRMLYVKEDFDISGQVDQSYVALSTSLESLPNGLKILEWIRFPQKSLPVDFLVENLVMLNMRNSFLEQLWDDNKELPNLKRLDLCWSEKLTRIPDLSSFPKIEEIYLGGCKSLIQVYSSRFLSKLKCLWLRCCVELTSLNICSNILSRSSGLVNLNCCCKLKTFTIKRADVVESRGGSHFYDANAKGTSGYQEMNGAGLEEEEGFLNLSGCSSLTSLPIDLCELKLLSTHDLQGCSNLEKFPEIEETMEKLVKLNLSRTIIQELPSSLHNLVGLEELSLQGCRRLKIIPSSIGKLTKLCELDLTTCVSLETFPSSIFKLKLTKLDLTGCSMLETFPEILEPAESFVCIKLNGTAIHELPSSLHRLVGLEELDLRGCRRLKIIPSSIGRLTKLCKLHLTECVSLETFPSNIFKLKLTELDLTGCSMLETFPKILEPAESFVCIKLNGTTIHELPSSLDRLVGLEELDLRGCRRLKIIPSSIGRLIKLCKLHLTECVSLETFPSNIFKLKLTELDLTGCSMLETFPKILEPAESFVCIKLNGTAIYELPSSLHRLVGLEELDLRGCRRLKIIPSSIGRLTKLCKLHLTECVSLETFPSNIFKLKLTELDLTGCSMLETFPKILEPAESFACINLTWAAVKELPSSLDCLVGLQTLCLKFCRDLESLPNSICNLNLLSELDCSGCCNLKEIPNDIGRLTSLRKLSLQYTRIVNLPESIAHLSSLESLVVADTGIVNLPESIDDLSRLEFLDVSNTRIVNLPVSIGNLSSLKDLHVSNTRIVNLPVSIGDLSSLKELTVSNTRIVNLPVSIAHLSRLGSLDVSYCKKLKCIPQLPLLLEELFAMDCPSIRRVILNSRFKRPSDCKEGTFLFYFTSNEKQDPSAKSDVVADARIRITEDAYRFVFYSFQGRRVPDWFPYRCKGNSITVYEDSLNWCNDNRLIGLAVCVVLRSDYDSYCPTLDASRCRLTFESDGCKHIIPNDCKLTLAFSQIGRVTGDFTFLWKYDLMDSASIDKGISHAQNITFEISNDLESCVGVIKCGICPLYAKEKDDIGGVVVVGDFSSSQRVSEHSSGKRQCLR